MTAKKIWGTIIIILGVIATIVGLLSIYGVYEQSIQIEAIKQMMGSEGANIFNSIGINQEAITNGYIKSFILAIVGIGLSIFGTKLISKGEQTNV
jgi:hypothetical protein